MPKQKSKVAVIVGCGMMGVPIAYGMHKLGFKIYLIDPSLDARLNAVKKLQSLKANVEGHLEDISWLTGTPDVLISAAPYYCNEKIADFCFVRKIPYCDLGGNPEISRKIQDKAREMKCQCFTDLGLAPGYANILCEELYSKTKKKKCSLQIMVGGLPCNPTGTLKYNLVFSPDGLYNEYIGDCEIIEDGEIKVVPALSGCSDLIFDESEAQLEAFYTKGGLGRTLELMQERGFKNCSYKTIRFLGHCRLIKFLLEECKISENDFKKMIENSCPTTTKDMVLIIIKMHDASGECGSILKAIDYDDHWTAMQKATAFPAAAVAGLLPKMALRDLDYSDVPLKQFKSNLQKIDRSI